MGDTQEHFLTNYYIFTPTQTLEEIVRNIPHRTLEEILDSNYTCNYVNDWQYYMNIHGVFHKNNVINHQKNHNCVSFTYINMTNYNFSGGAPVSKLSKRAKVGIQMCPSAIWCHTV